MYIKLFFIMMSSYLLGCFNTGYYLVRLLYGKDIRDIGSLSTGATNVSRLYGKKGFLIVLLGDSLKGFLAILMCKYLLGETSIVIQICLILVVLGHIFPIQLNFKGGKGIAVSLGAFLCFDYNLLILMSISFFILFIFLRDYKISGLGAYILLPIEVLFKNGRLIDSISLTLITLVIIYAHKKNIQDYILKLKLK
ncbi:glycerol-3-phosphate acyltransferase [Tepidibacter hydrothermalis]|uniref:Glycerol-3-phosphate acyltransferase n=1 Tax=Tepidibacter hydrothermalis TaxID=3036126 RepID=A0ABY8EAA8_9FIRM|nr:glycerol-3-phosphate acyltransferase [Tepidibacter hydrothermalis]WFD09834.1 glycerol-3-phosphate acyltransferase [Tepidibacter hydrothermalis]